MTDLTATTETKAPKRWYIIHTYSGYENKVKTNLEHRIESMGMEDKIFQVLVPMEDEIEMPEGQRHTVQKKVYPGYVLVEMILDPDSWFVVRNTPGVTSFVGSANIPGVRSEPIPSPRPRSSRSCGTWASRRRSTAWRSPRSRASGSPTGRSPSSSARSRRSTRAQQGQGPGEHLRPRDAGRARLPASRETLEKEPDQARGQEDPHRPDPAAARRRGDTRPAGRYGWSARHQHRRVHQGLQREDAGQARSRPSRPNRDLRGSLVQLHPQDPPAADLLRKAAGIEKGSGLAGTENNGRVTRDQRARSPASRWPISTPMTSRRPPGRSRGQPARWASRWWARPDHRSRRSHPGASDARRGEGRNAGRWRRRTCHSTGRSTGGGEARRPRARIPAR